MRNIKWMLINFVAVLFVFGIYFFSIYKDLPRTYRLEDYKPALITFVFDRNQQQIGEFFKERRFLVSFNDFPEHLIQAFVAAEDRTFFEHGGVHYQAIFRAFLANIKAGKKVQGGSTITQQVARSLLLSSKKTYTRKIQEVILAFRMEAHLSKQEILYLYLNQIYLGHGAYGVGMATKIYFQKEVKDLTLEESALLAGLPQAPSKFSPISNTKKAKARQNYVLSRMVEEGYLSEEVAKQSQQKSIHVFLRKNYFNKAPYFLETLRRLLIEEMGEEKLLTSGLKIHTSLDLNFQKEAQIQLKKGLKELDKRQGYRGALRNLSHPEEVTSFFQEREKKWMSKKKGHKMILANGEDGVSDDEFKKIEWNQSVQGVVTKVENQVAFVDLMFSLKGVIALETTQWARKPDKNTHYSLSKVDSLKNIFKEGDVIWVQLQNPKDHPQMFESLKDELKDELKEYQLLFLEQEPVVEGALISFDQSTQEIVAMVGGYDFSKSQFNRTYQAKRQTGSVFKPIIYSAALDKGFQPNTMITDEPVIYEDEEVDLLLKKEKNESEVEEEKLENEFTEEEDIEEEKSNWKPSNYSKNFSGNILFRNAFIQSLNIPTVKLVEKIGVPWIEFYSRRLGITSHLNLDYTIALGSSSVSLYEMSKAFAIFGRKGKKNKTYFGESNCGFEWRCFIGKL